MEDVRAQEEEAREEVDEAREETIKLAKMKEQYSEDIKQARIKELRERQAEISRDIKQLGGVEGADAAADSKTIVDRLEKRSKEIEQQLNEAERLQKENWEQTIQAINQSVQALQEEINKMTANLEDEEG